MELFSPRPQSFCTLDVKAKRPDIFRSVSLGLGDTHHVDDPALWNLLALTSRLLYKWEDPKVKKGDRPAHFLQLENAKADMDVIMLQKKTLRHYMSRRLSEAAYVLMASSLLDLSLCRDFHKGDHQALRLIITARLITMNKSWGRKVTKEQEAIELIVKSA